MTERNRKIMLFDIIYGAVILALLIELVMSGSVDIKSDAAFFAFYVAAALLIVLFILKGQKLPGNKIKHPWLFRKKYR